jgi:RNA polymerase sigma factor (sigma-70 family)
VDENNLLAASFEANRAHLKAVAFRMLGSRSAADDAVQESWQRLSRSDTSEVENLTGWLTTVVARVCLDTLRSRRSRKEQSLDEEAVELQLKSDAESDSGTEDYLADAVGQALLLVLDNLTPGERVAFVLHDVFAVSFDEIAPIVGRSATATRQLASRARRRMQGGSLTLNEDQVRQKAIVTAFLAASRRGEFDELLALLHPQIVLRADQSTVAMGGPPEVLGADAVAKQFFRRAQGAHLALLDDTVGLLWETGGQAKVAFKFRFADERVSLIELCADAEYLDELDWKILSA